MNKIGNNDPCPCLSGKKYKLCCQLKEAQAAAARFGQIGSRIDAAKAHQQAGRHAEAAALYTEVLQQDPHHPEALHWSGVLAYESGNYVLASTLIRQAIDLRPNALMYSSLGATLREQGLLDEALACHRQALSLDPHSADVYYNIGNALNLQGKLTEALASYEQALLLKPDYAAVLGNMATVLIGLGRFDEAQSRQRQALTLQPDRVDTHSNLIFSLDIAGNVDMAVLQQERRNWDSAHAAPLASLQRPHTNDTDPERRLRVGYVSADFCFHSAACVFGAMLLQFDASAFDVIAYSNTKTDDAQTQAFKARVTGWRNIVGLNDDAVAELIRQDNIDILVDLSGHSLGNRLLVFARKPAPIQITAWGYATSTGMKSIDVFFADPVLVPLEEKQCYAESVRYLPSMVAYTSSRIFPDVAALPALSSEGAITFGSLNRLSKVSEQSFQLWAQILKLVPNSRMVLKSAELDQQSVRDRVSGYFTREGIDPERLILLERSTWQHHMAVFNEIDIALDPFPHGGGVTTIEGIMMGVPAITLACPTITGRLSASILTTLGLTGWIAETPQQYVQIALQKANDVNALSTLRAQLRDVLMSSIIGDTAAYVQAVESEYRVLWREWCARTQSIPIIAQADAGITVATYFSLGNALQAQGQPEAAAFNFQKAIALQPDYADAHNKLGDVYRDQGQLEAAAQSYRYALALKPESSDLHNNLGFVLQAQGKLAAAIDSFQTAVSFKADHAPAHNNWGLALYSQGKIEQAIECYRKALAIEPEYADAHTNMGNALQSQGRIEEAIASQHKALQIKPDFAQAYNNLGNLLQAQGNAEAALDQYRRALLLKPDFVDAHSNLIFALDLAFGLDVAALQRERKRWDQLHAAPLAFLQRPHTNIVDPERRLRIGYVSADFRLHSAAFVFGAMLVNFDHSQFDVFAYSNTQNEDAQTEQFAGGVTTWRNIVGLSDDAVADVIRQDQIDILVDLSAHSADNRLLVFARKPAPLQVTAWGYATSTGMQAMDVFFADPVVVPPEEKTLYTEQIRYLPNVVGSFFPRKFPDVVVLPAISGNSVADAHIPTITFGSFNRLCKVSEPAFKAWAQVLLAIPNSKMILKTGELDGQGIRDKVLGFFTKEGVEPDRIILLGRSSWEEHMAAFNRIDIALDPFPHGGGVTTLEGIMMGVPVVTLRWNTIVGRLSASILTTLGLTDWIAETPEQYVQIAVQKASDLNALAELRTQLRDKLLSSVIGDAQVYVQSVEHEYRQLWREWCRRKQQSNEAGETCTSLPRESSHTTSTSHTIAEGLAHHQAGRLPQAQAIYRDILQDTPNHADALYLLGVLANQAGDHQQAIELFSQAIAIAPTAVMYFNLGSAFQEQEQFDEAIKSYRKALAIQPDFFEVQFNLADMLHRKDKLDDAVAGYQKVLSLKPDHYEAHFNLGVVFQKKNMPELAVQSFRAAVAVKPDFVAAYVNMGSALQELGKLDEAIEANRQALALAPDFAEVHHNLGLLFQVQGRLDAAIESYRQALVLKPDYAGAYNSLGLVYQSQGKLVEAQSCFEQAIRIEPDHAQAGFNLGNALHAQGKVEDAIASYRSVLTVQPDNVDAYINLARFLIEQGKLDEATESYDKALALKPDDAEIYIYLGNLLQLQHRFDAAIERYRQALALRPDCGVAHNNLGNAYKEQGNLDAAATSYQRAIALQSDLTEGHSNLGVVLEKQGQWAAALESHAQALALSPDNAAAHNNLGIVLHAQGRVGEAIESYRKALEVVPDYADAHMNMGQSLLSAGQLDAAIESLHTALSIRPGFAEGYNNLGNVLQAQGKTDAALAQYRHAILLKPDFSDAHSNLIFTLDLACDLDTAALQQERKRWDEAHAMPLISSQRPHANSADPQRRLRIGYVSADFRMHSAAFVFGAMLVDFDCNQFDVFAYSNTRAEDEQTTQFSRSVTCWRKIVGLSDDAVAELIRQDKVDILVDLSGHSAGNRLLMFARKPAPLQVTAWGYALSTGMQAIDVFFADSVVVPPEERTLFTEEVRYLPNVVGSFFPRPFPDVGILPARSADNAARIITFGSFNRLVKVSEQAFKVWAQVLLAVPHSKIVLKTPELGGQSTRDRVRECFTREGVDADRIILLGGSSWEEHMAAFNQVDIALDPFPHGGGVTTVEGIMMGVPVVTLRWRTAAGRLSASILTTLGLIDWIADTPEQYVQIAVKKASDLNALAELRTQLRGKLLSSVIGDAQSYVAAVEHEYRQLWQEWCERQETADEISPSPVLVID